MQTPADQLDSCAVSRLCAVVGQVREKVVQWTESNVTASYFSKELQAEVDRLARLQGRGLLRLRSACSLRQGNSAHFYM
jgi:hypothetical protein